MVPIVLYRDVNVMRELEFIIQKLRVMKKGPLGMGPRFGPAYGARVSWGGQRPVWNNSQFLFLILPGSAI